VETTRHHADEGAGAVVDAARPDDDFQAAAERLERAIQEIQTLDVVLKRTDKNVAAAVKRAIKRSGDLLPSDE
jgi:hypothetical protein